MYVYINIVLILEFICCQRHFLWGSFGLDCGFAAPLSASPFRRHWKMTNLGDCWWGNFCVHSTPPGAPQYSPHLDCCSSMVSISIDLHFVANNSQNMYKKTQGTHTHTGTCKQTHKETNNSFVLRFVYLFHIYLLEDVCGVCCFRALPGQHLSCLIQMIAQLKSGAQKNKRTHTHTSWQRRLDFPLGTDRRIFSRVHLKNLCI